MARTTSSSLYFNLSTLSPRPNTRFIYTLDLKDFFLIKKFFFLPFFYLHFFIVYKPLGRRLTFNRWQPGSCSATLETLTKKHVVYKWFSTIFPMNMPCMMGEGPAAFLAPHHQSSRSRALKSCFVFFLMWTIF